MLADAFLSYLDPNDRARLEQDRAGLERALAALVQSARAAWPDLSVPTEGFLRHAAERLSSGDVTSLRGADLFLAYACQERDPAALVAFDATHAAEIGAVLVKMGVAHSDGDDLRQRLREKLFANGGISQYTGLGELRAWVRVALVRAALNHKRDGKKHVELDEGLAMALAVPTGSAELELMKRAYAADFRAAFAHAIASLPARDRNLLHLHFVHGLPLERVGAIYRVHRSTASRWLAKAQQDILAGTRRELASRLRVTPPELESIMRLIQSRLELSLDTVLISASG